jgi:hypothetical protein
MLRLCRNLYGIATGWNITVSHWFYLWNLWNIAVDMHGLAVGSVLQDLHLRTISPTKMVMHVVLTLLWAPIVQLAHSIIFISALIRPASNFVVIKKV